MDLKATELAEEWLANYRNPNTRRAYERDSAEYLDWCESAGVAALEARRIDLNRWLSSLIAKGRTDQTIHRKLAAVRGLYEFLVIEEVLDRNPVQHIKFRWQRGDSATPWLTEEELKALLLASTQTSAPLRDLVMCSLLGLNGLRINEVYTARIEDLSMTGGHPILWVLRKGRKRTKVPLDPRLASIIQTYLEWLGNGSAPTKGPLVVSTTRWGTPRIPLRPITKQGASYRLKKIARAAGVNPNISPHSLRHSFATLALGKGVPLHFVQAAMAHSDPATTMHYNRDADNLDNNPTFLISDLMFGTEEGLPQLEAGEEAV